MGIHESFEAREQIPPHDVDMPAESDSAEGVEYLADQSTSKKGPAFLRVLHVRLDHKLFDDAFTDFHGYDGFLLIVLPEPGRRPRRWPGRWW